jgi:hypothetical protein
MSRTRQIRVLARFAAVAFALLLPAASNGEAPKAGVIVLRNGNVLAGRVEHTGDLYRVEAEGWSIQVPAEQVDSACGTLREAYDVRRKRLGGSVEAHVELAHWCLRQELLAEAAREILDIRIAEPMNSAIPALELRLRQLAEVLALSPTADKAVGGSSPMVAGGQGGENSAAAPGASLEVQMQFVRSIQPMLIHGCATGGCHQPGAMQQLQLDRWALDGVGNRTLIRRNLASVLAAIHKEESEQSPLLERARQSHGGLNQAASRPLSRHQLSLLTDWVNRASGKTPAIQSPSVDSSEAYSPADASALDTEVASEIEAELTSLEKPAAATPKFKPRDAFDPEIFNRRHATRAFSGLPPN